jgi:hypothetical protein
MATLTTGFTGTERRRRLFVPQESCTSERAKEMMHPRVIGETVQRAGEEALRCSGWGWIPELDFSVTQGRGLPLVLHLIGFKSLAAEINALEIWQRGARLCAANAGPNPLAIVENAVGALVRLFAGHFSVCPWDAWRHADLVDAAIWSAFGSGGITPREARVAVAIAAFFERLVVAHALTEIEEEMFVTGLAQERGISGSTPSLLLNLFQRVQFATFPKPWRLAMKINPPVDDPLADALFPDVIFAVFRARLLGKHGRLRIRGKARRPTSREWVPRVEELARILAPHIEDAHDGRTTPNPFLRPLPDGDGQTPGERGWGIGPGDNPFVDGRDPRRARGRAGLRPHTGPPGQDAHNDFAAIDRHYSERAEALVVRDDGEVGLRRRPELVTVGHLDCEEASALDLVSGQIDWFHTRWRDPGGLQLFRRADPLRIRAKHDDPIRQGLPHLLLLVDSSGSMRFNPLAPAPEQRGNYDIVLTACWGIFRHIEGQRVADRVQAHALNFSSRTDSSGWTPCSDLIPVKRTLAIYQGQGTRLDVRVLQRAVETSPGPFLAIAITDGGLAHTDLALAALREMVEAGNRLVLLHIGTPNKFTDGAREIGADVHVLKSSGDLLGLCLDLAKTGFRGRKC